MARTTPQLAKLTRPRNPRAAERRRLFERLDLARSQCPVLCVVGPPGAGKTTLVSSFLASYRIQGIWYQLDPGDSDPATLFHYLSTAATPFTHKRKQPLPVLKAEYLNEVEAFARRFFRDLFARLPDDSAVVIDDYQEVAADRAIHRLLATAVDEVPSGRNLILISRADLPECYARAIANERIAFIGSDLLKLDCAEAESIATSRCRIESRQFAKVYELSDGWAAGFVLMLEHMGSGESIATSEGSDSLRAIFDYFAGELFGRMSKSSQNLLLELSYLPQMSTTAAQELTESAHATVLLADLHRRHLFTHRRKLATWVYQFHALLRAFLQDRAHSTLDPIAHRRLALRAASILAREQQFEEAVGLYLQAEDFQAVQDLVLRRAAHLLEQGRSALLADWIEALPPERRHGDCWLTYWLGIARMSTQSSQARRHLEESFHAAERCGDLLCQSLAAAAVVQTHIIEYTDFRPLDRWIVMLQDLTRRGVVYSGAEAELRVQSALLIALAFRQPTNPDLPRCVERVFALLQTDADADLRAAGAMHLLRYGVTAGPLDVSRRAIHELEALLTNTSVSPFTAAMGLSAMTWFYCITRERQACLDTCARFDRIAEDHGLTRLTKVALINRMWLALFSFDAAEGKKYLTRLESVSNPSHPFDLATLHGAMAWIALIENKLDRGMELAHAAVESFDRAGSVMHQANFRNNLIVGYFKLRQFERARESVQAVRQIMGSALTSWQECSMLMWEANIALEEGDMASMRQKLSDALLCAEHKGGGFMLANWLGPWMPRLCNEALIASIQVDYVRRLIAEHRFPSPSVSAPQWPWPVRIYTFGRFEILRGDETLVFGRKSPRRVLSVLKCILAHGPDGILMRDLADVLWPEQEADLALRTLGVALTRLRQLLGSHEFVSVSGERVSLNRALVWSDAFSLELLPHSPAGDASSLTCPAIQATVDRLLALYQGDFLPFDRDEAWTLRPRMRLRARFIRCLTALAGVLEGRQEWHVALECYQRALEVDDRAEEFYQGLMRCFAALGQPSSGIATYQKLRQLLSLDHGVAPSPATETLVERLLAQFGGSIADAASPNL